MKLFRSVVTVSGFTGISRVFGLLREILMSHFLGASLVADAFIIAFKFPNFFRRFFAEGAFNAAFLPEFAGILANSGKKAAHQLANQVFSWLVFVLLLFVGFIVIFTPLLIHIIAPGFAYTPERLAYAIEFTRITFPYILFISLAALLSGILNALNRFAAAAATPILLNIFMIIALLLATQHVGFSLSISVFIAGIVQFVWLYAITAKHGFRLKLEMPTLTPSVRKILKLMGPGAIGAGVMQINIFIDMVLASLLPTGAPAYLYYADRLNQLPLSIFGVAIGTVLLPNLSKSLRLGKKEEATSLQEKAIILGLRLSIPSALGLIVLSYPLINLIYGHGSFTSENVAATAPTLAAFALGLPAYVLSKIFTTSFFAMQNTKTPLKVGLFTVAINFFLNLAFIIPLKHIGMALATGLAAWAQAGILVYILYQKRMLSISSKLLRDLFYITTSSFAMAGIIMKISSIYPCPESLLKAIIYNVGLVGIGVVIYSMLYQVYLLIDKKVCYTSTPT